MSGISHLDAIWLLKPWWKRVSPLLRADPLISRKSSWCGTFSSRIQNLGWTEFESTLKIIIIDVENSSFGCNLTFETLVKKGLPPCCVRTLWFLKLVPWRRVLRTTCPLEKNASHHLPPTWGTSCRGEGVRSTLLTWEYEKSTRNHQKSMISKMNQDTSGDFLKYQ